MRSIWDTLGIEATADLLAIKRAYAARLKITRPDDDAGAYQQLREAYEWAQQHARWQREQAPEEAEHSNKLAEPAPTPSMQDAAASPAQRVTAPVVASTTNAPPVRSEVIDPPATPDRTAPAHEAVHVPDQAPNHAPEEAQPGWIHPQALASSLLDHWRTQGDDALLQAWPALTQHLDNVPLSLRSESSVWFAELVLQHDQLPRDFIENLARYFAWGQDYRVEQILGFERAEKLRTLLTSDHIRPIRDEATLKQYEDLFTLDRLWSRAQRAGKPEYKAYLFAFLAHPRLGAHAQATPPRILRALGFEPPVFAGLAQATKVAMWLRAAVILLIICLIETEHATIPRGDWFLRVFLVGALSFVGLIVSGFVSNFVAILQGGWSNTNSLHRWFEKYRGSTALLASSAAGFAVAWGVATVAWISAKEDWIYRYPWAFGSWLVLMFGSIVTTWPRKGAAEFLTVPIAFLLFAAVHTALSTVGGSFAAAAVVGFIMCCAQAVKHHPEGLRWLRIGLAIFLVHSIGVGTLLIVRRAPLALEELKMFYVIATTVAVLMLPAVLTWLSESYGLRLPLAAVGLACSAPLFGLINSSAQWALAPLTLLSALALVALQWVGTTLSRLSWFRSEPTS